MWNERLVRALGRPEMEGSVNHRHDLFERSRIITLTIRYTATECDTQKHNGKLDRTRLCTA